MASLLDIGRSAIHAQREALNVTGQNIANANTEGYRRRDATLSEVSGVQSELTSLNAQTGMGVRLDDVRRAYDSFLTDSKRAAAGRFESSDAFVTKLERLENSILPNDGDLGVAMTAFFETLGQIAAQPGDLAARAVAIDMGHTVSNAFNTTALLLGDLADGTASEIETRLVGVNQNLDALASLNGQLRASNLGGSPPNALLDERDRLIDNLSKMVPLSVTIGERYEAELRLGTSEAGALILRGEDSKTLSVVKSEQGSIMFRIGSGQIVPQLESGALRGLVDAHGTTNRALSELDTLARSFTAKMNTQHAQGIDLEGQLGKELFTTASFTPQASQTNQGTAEAAIRLVPGRADQLQQMSMQFNARTDQWTLTDDTGSVLATGRTKIEANGAVIDVTGTPKDGDKIVFERAAGDASRISFLLRRPEEIAAASTVAIYPETSNLGTAKLETLRAADAGSGVPALTDMLANNLSPVAAQEFLRGGVVGSIPRGTTDITLASLATQTTATVSATEGADIAAITLELDGDSYSFALDPQTVSADNWQSGTEIAEYLNMGVLATADGQTIHDLGLSVSGFESGLSLASDGSRVLTAMSAVSAEGNTLATDVQFGQAASELRIFTREGRQISGPPLAPNEVEQFITTSNGFNAEAEYRADYSTLSSGTGYRGMEITQSRTVADPMQSGLNTLSTSLVGLRGSNIGMISTDSRVNNTIEQTVRLQMSKGYARSLTIPAAVDAAYVAEMANAEFAAVGVSAQAQTAVRLTLEELGSGAVEFDITGRNGDPLNISAQVNNGDLSALADAINSRSDETGVQAQLSATPGALMLIQVDGFDIGLSNASTTGVAIQAASLDQDFKPLPLDDGDPPETAIALSGDLRISGTVQFISSQEFTLSSDRTGEVGHVMTSATDPMVGGLVQREFSAGGTAAALRYNIDTVLDGAGTSADGTRTRAPSARFETTLTLADGTVFGANAIGGATPSAEMIALDTASQMRAQAPVPLLLGASMPAENFPDVGKSTSFMLGDAEYTLTRIAQTDPTRVSPLDFEVTGPEADRISTSLVGEDGVYALSLSVAGGHLSGQGLTPVANSTAAAFGLSTVQSSASVQGRAIPTDLSDGTYEIGLTLEGTAHSVTVTALNGDLDINVPLSLQGRLSVDLGTDTTGAPTLSLRAKQAGIGTIAITPSTDAEALGFKVAHADLRVEDGILHAHSTDGSALDIVAGGTSAASSFIRLSNIPDEELIVIMGREGARQLAGQFDVGPILAEAERAPEHFRVEMIDAATGRVELFDRESGVSIATRTSNGLARFNISGQDIELSGFADTGDAFNLSTAQRSAGNAQNMDVLASFGQQRAGETSFQDEFRTIAAGVGATLEAARLTRLSNDAVHEAAIAAESEFSGVNMDEEAAKLMSQQQAYQAAARILQTAREMFDTLLQIA